MKICMILKRSFEQLKKDSRVLKEARSLMSEGYDVSIVIHGDKSGKTYEKLNGIDVKIAGIHNFRILERFNPFRPPPLPVKAWLYGKVQSSAKVALPKVIIFVKTIIRLVISQIYQVQYFVKTLRVLLRERVDVYHAHDFEALLLGYLAALTKKTRLVYDSHELWVESREFSSPFKRKFIRPFVVMMEHFLIKRADGVITVNESIAKHLAHKYKIDKPVVVSNFSERFSVGASDVLREKLALDKKKKIVLYQGGIMTGRGLEKLVECSRYLDNDIIVVLMGYGHLKKALQKKIEAENIHRVKILDAVPLDVLINYTASADIGISPIQNICLNHYYSLPNKIGEYIMAGIPFAVSNFPEMRKLAIEENMGAVFDPEDCRSIASAVNELLDPKLYALKKENVLRARETYNWGKESLKLVGLYSGLKAQKNVN